MAKSFDFYFDFGSPTSYLAYTQVPGLAKRTGATAHYKPILLGGIFQATGNRTPVEVPAKGRYMFDDMKWFAARYGVPFRENPYFILNTLGLMRGAIYAQLEGFLIPYADAVFRGVWADALNMADPAIASKVLAEAGLDAPKILAATQDPAIKEALKSATEAAVQRGLFGAPTFFVGARMHFGQDRLPYVEELLRD